MAADNSAPAGPDLSVGIPSDALADGGMLAGHVGDDPVLLARRGDEVFAIGARCTHYGGPLAEGLLVDETVRCPWHHACFDLHTGAAVRAPALTAAPCWAVERRDGKIVVRGKREQPKPRRARPASSALEKVVIVGGGAAGFAAAEMLR